MPNVSIPPSVNDHDTWLKSLSAFEPYYYKYQDKYISLADTSYIDYYSIKLPFVEVDNYYGSSSENILKGNFYLNSLYNDSYWVGKIDINYNFYDEDVKEKIFLGIIEPGTTPTFRQKLFERAIKTTRWNNTYDYWTSGKIAIRVYRDENSLYFQTWTYVTYNEIDAAKYDGNYNYIISMGRNTDYTPKITKIDKAEFTNNAIPKCLIVSIQTAGGCGATTNAAGTSTSMCYGGGSGAFYEIVTKIPEEKDKWLIFALQPCRNNNYSSAEYDFSYDAIHCYEASPKANTDGLIVGNTNEATGEIVKGVVEFNTLFSHLRFVVTNGKDGKWSAGSGTGGFARTNLVPTNQMMPTISQYVKRNESGLASRYINPADADAEYHLFGGTSTVWFYDFTDAEITMDKTDFQYLYSFGRNYEHGICDVTFSGTGIDDYYLGGAPSRNGAGGDANRSSSGTTHRGGTGAGGGASYGGVINGGDGFIQFWY